MVCFYLHENTKKKCTLWIGIIDFDKRRYKLSWFTFISTKSKKGDLPRYELLAKLYKLWEKAYFTKKILLQR